MAFGDLKGTLTISNGSTLATNDFIGSVAVAVGDLVFAALGEGVGTLTSTGATDDLGNTYTAQNAGISGSGIAGRSFWARVTNAGTLTKVTIAATASAADLAGVAAVIEGPFATAPLDANPANVSDSTTPYNCPATGTLAQAAEVVMAWMVQKGNSAIAATSPNLLATSVLTSATAGAAVGYQAVAATTSVVPVFTGGNNNSVLGTASFKKSIVDTVAASNLTVPSPVLGTPTLSPKFNLTAAALAASSPAIASPTLLPISNLTAAALAAGSPAFTPAQSSQKHVLTGASLVVGSPDIGTSQLWLAPPSLVVGPPDLPAPTLAQRQALAAAPLTAATPTLGAPAFQGVAPLGVAGLSVAAPALGAPVFVATSGTGAASLTVGAPVLAAPQIWLTPPPLTIGAPAIQAPAIGQRHALAALPLTVLPPHFDAVIFAQAGQMAGVPIEVQPPDLGTPALGQEQGIVAASLTVSAPAIGSPAMVSGVPLTAVALTVAAPVLGAPAFAAISHLVAADFATAAPAIDAPTFQQEAHLVAATLAPAGPDIGTASLAPTSYLTAVSLAPLPPQLGAAILNQRHDLGIPHGVTAGIWKHTPVVYSESGKIAAVPLEVGSPDIGVPDASQVHRLSAALAIGSPDIGSPVLQSTCGLTAIGIDPPLMFLPEPKLGQMFNLITASEIIFGVDIGVPYFHFVDHAYRYTQEQPRRTIAGTAQSPPRWDGQAEGARWTGQP